MKLVIELPDWAEERHIYVMAGIEMLAYKLYGEDVINIKAIRCIQCGKCCMDLKVGMGLPIDEKGTCIHLEKIGQVYECGLGVHRPYMCSIGLEQKGRKGSPDCAIEYRQKKVK